MENNVDSLVEARLPTKFGNFRLIAFHGDSKDKEDLGKLAIFEGVNKYPARVKCATLSWHALMAAIEGKKEASTE